MDMYDPGLSGHPRNGLKEHRDKKTQHMSQALSQVKVAPEKWERALARAHYLRVKESLNSTVLG